ncbi:MAG: TrkH family potassium uptake protein [Ruminococcaceae bacterium]|nr:TrkH family potassium uptake protein [Oscillospiraceae bacterium]
MNRKIILFLVGRIVLLESALLALPLLCSLIYGEKCTFAFLITIAIAIAVGIVLTLLGKTTNRTFFAKEGFVIVAFAWIMLSIIGALPFTLSGYIPSFIDAFFETVSGFTTTGASILTDVEALPHGLLFWRSFTHWIGGMGILVLVMAIVPTDTGRSMHIMRAEMPGPIIGKLVPKIKTTAKILYLIYIVLTALEVIFLLFGKMSLFESLVYSFGTAGTGGFGIDADSLASYSPYNQWVITIFMLIFGINFNIYFLILSKKFVSVLKSEELLTYIIIVLVSIGVITVNVMHNFPTFSEALRHSAFQVSSIITTTGYSTVDFNLWPSLSKAILLILMFIGGCAGSTAGGIKVSRIVLLFKSMGSNLKHMLHPRSIESFKFEGKTVKKETINNVGCYLAIYLVCLFAVFLVISFDPFDFETHISAAFACFNNVGPGFSAVGPLSSYAAYSPLSKLVLSAAMLLGRLEIFPMILLFAPSVWIKNKALKKQR